MKDTPRKKRQRAHTEVAYWETREVGKATSPKPILKKVKKTARNGLSKYLVSHTEKFVRTRVRRPDVSPRERRPRVWA
jgi:hypothetical protein